MASCWEMSIRELLPLPLERMFTIGSSVVTARRHKVVVSKMRCAIEIVVNTRILWKFLGQLLCGTRRRRRAMIDLGPTLGPSAWWMCGEQPHPEEPSRAPSDEASAASADGDAPPDETRQAWSAPYSVGCVPTM